MEGWLGVHSEYDMTPYVDFNLLKFSNKDHAMEKIKDLTMPSDILLTRFHGAITAGVQAGSIMYIAGAGPVALTSAASCHLLGAAVVIIGDLNQERLAHARTFGCENINLANGIPIEEQIAMIVGIPKVDYLLIVLFSRMLVMAISLLKKNQLLFLIWLWL